MKAKIDSRDNLRKKQNELIKLAANRYPDYFKISAEEPESPTIGQLKDCIYPQWENSIDNAIKILKR